MLPVIRLEGPPAAQGRAHGEALREAIAHNLDVYFDRFLREARLDRAEVLARAARYRGAIEAMHPDYAAAMRGVAEGAGADALEIVALNVRYEILYHQFTAIALADGCTAFAALPEATVGHLLMGQNWDWIPQVRGAVLHIVEADVEVLCFAEAGIVGGKIGLNSRGVGLAVNGLTSTGDDWSRLARPFHVRCHDALRGADLASARLAVGAPPHGCSANFLVGCAGEGAVDLETAPSVVHPILPERGTLAHTNHFVDPGAIGVTEPRYRRRPLSVHRLARMRALLEAGRPHTPAGLMTALRDHDGHPNSVCRHPDPTQPDAERYQTVTSVVMDLDARAMWISDGPPCGVAYQVERLIA
jgi:isopenicillin-N N-acyltransferase like protein